MRFGPDRARQSGPLRFDVLNSADRPKIRAFDRELKRGSARLRKEARDWEAQTSAIARILNATPEEL